MRVVLIKMVLVKTVPVRVVLMRMVLMRTVPMKTLLMRVALVRVALVRVVLMRTAPFCNFGLLLCRWNCWVFAVESEPARITVQLFIMILKEMRNTLELQTVIAHRTCRFCNECCSAFISSC